MGQQFWKAGRYKLAALVLKTSLCKKQVGRDTLAFRHFMNMKLRIILKGDLYIPQYRKADDWNGHFWVGFGHPNIKFATLDLARQFVDIIARSVPSAQGATTRVVWGNANPPKRL